MRLPSPRSAGRLATLLLACLLWSLGARAQHDLSIFRVASDNYLQRGDIVSFTFVVTNDRGTDVTGVGVDLDLPDGLRYLQHSLSQTFDPVSGRWDVGDIRFFQPQRIITIDFEVVGDGVQIVTAEVAAMDGTDSDSTPGNGVLDEDDIVSACVTVPIRAECGQSVRIAAPAGYPAYEWYHDGVLLVNETGNEINVGASGRYNFQIPGATSPCVLGSCCPAEVTFDSISVALSQNQLCTGGLDTVFVDMPDKDDKNFTQVYTWTSIDDPSLRFLSCTDCGEPAIVIDEPYAGGQLRYQVSVVTRDRFGDVVCSAGATLSVDVWQAPVLTFDVPEYACAEVCRDIAVAPDLATASVAWDGPDLRTPDGLVMQYCPRGVPDYQRERFVVTAVGLDGCVRVDSAFTTVMPGFAVAATGDPRVCQNLPAALAAVVTPAQPTDSLRYAWTEFPSNPGSGANLPVTDAAAITTGALAPGSYGFRVSVQRMAPNGEWVCTYEAEHALEVESDCAQPRLGGYAWLDANRDGLRQNTEPPFENVTVTLFRADGTATGQTAATDAVGFYEFLNLPIGDYYVTFAAQPNFAFAPQNVGTDEFIDSDADPTGRSDVFAATYDEAVHVVGAGYVGDCRLALVDVTTAPSNCGDSEGAVRFGVDGGSGDYSYAWQPNVSADANATGLPAGDYVVTVTDEVTGCTLTQTLVVPGTSNFNLTASSSPAACPLGKGGSITLFTNGGTGPFTVDYSGRDDGALVASAMPFTIRDLYAGDYDVTVSDASGCTQLVTVAVTENAMLLSIAVVDIVEPSCRGRADGRFAVTVDGFEQGYTLTLDGLEVVANGTAPRVDLPNQTPGEKTVVVRDVNDCAQAITFTLENGGPDISPADLTVVDADCYGAATGGIAARDGSTYEVRDAAGQLVGNLPASGLVAGEYTVVDRRDPTCVATLDVTIGEPTQLVADAETVGTGCDVEVGRVSLAISGATAPYTVTWADGTGDVTVREGLAAGDYAATVTDARGCVLAATYTVPDLCRPLVCEEFFTADTLLVYADARGVYDWCMPNFVQPVQRQFFVDGAEVRPEVCTRSELVYYNLEGLPGDGEAGPYLIEFWFGGDAIAIGELALDGAGFAEAMDAADRWGRWRHDAERNFISGGQPTRAYGEIEVTDVRSGEVYFLTPQILPNQLSASLSYGVGAYDVSTVRTADGCVDRLHLVVVPEAPCGKTYEPEPELTATPYCNEPAPVCIDVPFDLMDEYDLRIGGQRYTGSTEPCDVDQVVYYDLNGLDLASAFRLESWELDGRSRTARLANGEELAARLTQFDNREWRYDADLGIVRGGLVGGAYGTMSLLVDGRRTRVQPQRDVYDGTRIELLAGTYAASLVGPDGCAADFSIALRCSSQGVPTTDTVRWTVGVGFTDTACVSTAELSAGVSAVENLCPDLSGRYATVSRADSSCYRVTGLAIGLDTMCVVVCDENAVCDTTVVIVDVRDPLELLFPIAVDDTVDVSQGQFSVIPVLDNDTTKGPLLSFEVIGYPRNGRVRFEEDNGLRYEPGVGYCGVDSMVYEICNAAGCDEATVRITVDCGGLTIFSGFSPNYDGINETFEVLGVEQYPGNRMEIYNRGGNLVFEMDDYDNSWRGEYFDGDELPEGTYYYIFDDGRGEEYTGYVYLRRYGN